jgi:hypothetical protein
MASHSTTSLGGIKTPLSPGEALARFSPLESRGIVPLQLPKRRHASSRWRHDAGNWLPEEGKTTVVTRSISASAVPGTVLPRKTSHTEHFTRDRVTGWRPAARHEQTGGYEHTSYTAKQMAGFQLYEMKSKRLSSLEYGKQVPIVEVPIKDIGHNTPARQDSPPPQDIKLEVGMPAVSPITNSPTTFALQPQPCVLPSQPTHSIVQSCSDTTPIAIFRKPVGSGSSAKTPTSVRSKSDPLLIWTLDKTKSPERPGSQSPRKWKLECEYSSMFQDDQQVSPWGTHVSPPSPSRSLKPRRPRPGLDIKRARPPVRFQSNPAAAQEVDMMGQYETERHYDEHRSSNCGTSFRCVPPHYLLAHILLISAQATKFGIPSGVFWSTRQPGHGDAGDDEGMGRVGC